MKRLSKKEKERRRRVGEWPADTFLIPEGVRVDLCAIDTTKIKHLIIGGALWCVNPSGTLESLTVLDRAGIGFGAVSSLSISTGAKA